MKFLDSSIWLAYLVEANKKATDIIETEDALFCSILTLFEIKKKLILSKMAEKEIKNSIEFLKTRSALVDINEEIINIAAYQSINNKLSAVDSIIYASALHMESIFITADNDFRGLDNVEIIDKN